jgi:hypothetical protein
MSQQGISVLSLPILALGAVAEYRAVGFNGAQATVAGQKVLGIAEFGAANAQMVRVCRLGTAVAEAGAAIAIGAALAVDASGRVVTASALASTIGSLNATVGTLAIAAGATPVTSAAANGTTDISGAPGLGGAPALSGGDPPQYIVGYAMQAASAAGDFIEIALA